MVTKKDLSLKKKEFLRLKKSTKKTFTDSIITTPTPILLGANKALREDEEDVIYRTIIGNTYNWLDSHGDVHVANCFKKSIRERGGDVLHLHDHVPQLSAKVGTPISVYEAEIEWKKLNVNKDGYTQSLFMDSAIKRAYNGSIFEQYKANEINQHSVGMFYVDVDVAIDYATDVQAYKNFHDYLPLLGNPEKALELGYFYIVKQAKLDEISAVTQGSNSLTPTLGQDGEVIKEIYKKFGDIDKFYEFCKNTLNIEPRVITQKQAPKKKYYNYLKTY